MEFRIGQAAELLGVSVDTLYRRIARRIVGTLKPPTRAALNMQAPREPLFPAEEIYGVVSADGRKPFDEVVFWERWGG